MLSPRTRSAKSQRTPSPHSARPMSSTQAIGCPAAISPSSGTFRTETRISSPRSSSFCAGSRRSPSRYTPGISEGAPHSSSSGQFSARASRLSVCAVGLRVSPLSSLFSVPFGTPERSDSASVVKPFSVFNRFSFS